jgi:hypothetical protein
MNQQPPMHQFKMKLFKLFLGMNQKHIFPYPRFLVFLASSNPKFSLLPTSLLLLSSYLPHLILCSFHHQSSRELEARGQKKEGRTMSQKWEGKSGRQDKVLESTEYELESKLPPFFLCFLVVFCCVREEEDDSETKMRHCLLLWRCCSDKGDNNYYHHLFLCV